MFRQRNFVETDSCKLSDFPINNEDLALNPSDYLKRSDCYVVMCLKSGTGNCIAPIFRRRFSAKRTEDDNRSSKPIQLVNTRLTGPVGHMNAFRALSNYVNGSSADNVLTNEITIRQLCK